MVSSVVSALPYPHFLTLGGNVPQIWDFDSTSSHQYNPDTLAAARIPQEDLWDKAVSDVSNASSLFAPICVLSFEFCVTGFKDGISWI